VTISWNGTSWTLTDGTQSSFIALEPWVKSNTGASLSFVPGKVKRANSVLTYPANGIYDDSTGKVKTFLVTEGSRVVSFTAQELTGAQFIPTLSKQSDPANKVEQQSLALTSSGLSLSTYQVPAGDYSLQTSITDMWGNVGFASPDNVTVVTPFGP